MLIMIVFLLANFGFVNYRLLLAKQDIINDAVTSSALAALSKAEPIKMAYGKIEYTSDAQSTFYAYLRKNLNLDANNNPLSNSQVVSITVNDLKIYNGPGTAPDGTQIAKPSVYVDVTAAVKNVLGKPVPIHVRKIVDVDYQL